MSGRRAARPLGQAVLVLALCAAAPVPAGGQMFVTTGRDTLRDLPGIEVAVEDPPAALARAGLTREALHERIVTRVRRAGIRVYASQKENPSPAKPYLYLHLNALELGETRLYAIAVQLQVRQTLQSPQTQSHVVNAMTWDTHNVVGAAAADLAAVGEEIDAYVDLFIEDWRAVH